MGAISKILSKINKAKSAINSLKGIGAKLESLNYTSQVDKLGEQAEYAQQLLKDRRLSLEKSMDAANVRKSLGKKNPTAPTKELIYPVNDALENYIVFTTRPRKTRSTQRTTDNSGKAIAEGKRGEPVKDTNLFGPSQVIEIQLYIPDGITSDTTVGYSSQNIGPSARRLDEGIQAVSSAWQSGKISSAVEKGTEIGGAVIGDLVVKSLNAMTGGIANIKEGKAVNPMKEQLLTGTDFRTFDFNYEFWPKNEAEANMVNQIIYTFRTAMLPDTYGFDGADVQNWLNMPNIFDVEFEGPIAGKVDGFLPMVCTGCSVDHFNGQKVTTFANGQPVSSSMKLTFSEIKVLSQESYQGISPFASNAGKELAKTQMESAVDNYNPKFDDKVAAGGGGT